MRGRLSLLPTAVPFRKWLRFPRGDLEPPHFVAGSQDCRYSPAGVFAICSNPQLRSQINKKEPNLGWVLE